MTVFILDSHGDDFIHRPISFYLARRRALQKYKYFSDLPGVQYLSSGLVSSMPASLQGRLPKVVLRCLVFFEVRVWSIVNKIIISNHSVFKCDDVIVLLDIKRSLESLHFLLTVNLKDEL